MRIPPPPEFDFGEKAIENSKIRFQIWTCTIGLIYIFLYLCFRRTTAFSWLVKLIFVAGVIFVVYLNRKLQAQVRAFSSQLPPPKERPASFGQEPGERRSNIGFSEETVRKAMPLFRRQFENFDEQYLINKFTPKVNYPTRSYLRDYEVQKKSEYESPAFQPGNRQPERSIFESISNDWPKRWATINPPKDIRSLSPFYRETNVLPKKDIGRSADIFSGRQPQTYGPPFARQPSEQPNRPATPIKTFKRADSRLSLSKAKQSVFSRYDLRRDYIPEYETISASEQALNSALMDLNINLDKFYIWAFSNMQVWFAFDFIPELLQRNLVV
jgi:hypothetical protein